MGTVKVVPVEQEAPVEVQPSEEVPSDPEVPVAREPVAEILASEAPVIAENKPAPKKEQANVTCDNCGKSMLVKHVNIATLIYVSLHYLSHPHHLQNQKQRLKE